MQVEKFNSQDRALLIKAIEDIQKTQLKPVNNFRKILESTNGIFYIINGGTDDWHGLNNNLIKYISNIECTAKEHVFIVAKKYRTQIDVYVGPLSILIANLSKLIVTKSGDYQFHCVHTEDGLYLLEVPELVCNKVHSIYLPNHKKFTEIYKYNASLLNIDIPIDIELTHSDVQAKLLLIGSYLNFRTYTPDVSKFSEVFKCKLG